MRSDTKPKIFRMTIISTKPPTFLRTTGNVQAPPAPRGLPARRRGRICAHMSMLEAGEGAAPARPLARPRHPRQRPLTSPPAASALRRLIDEDQLWSCEICARRHTREGVKGGRRSRAVAVTRRWVVCAAKQGLQQHRELQRTLQRTWSPAERYSASRVVPVARRHSEGVRCSRGERFSVRGHRIAPVAHGRPPLENREESDRAAMHALTATAPRRRNCRFTASSRFLNGKKGRAI